MTNEFEEDLEEERSRAETESFLARIEAQYKELYGHPPAENLSLEEVQELIRQKAIRPFRL